MLGDRTSQLKVSCGTGVTAWHSCEQDQTDEDGITVGWDS
jgi:hypothetical protein